MSVRVYVPRDSAALSVGAEGVARAIASEAAQRKLEIELVRNGSRGAFREQLEYRRPDTKEIGCWHQGLRRDGPGNHRTEQEKRSDVTNSPEPV